eukprot:5148984-Prymnesium_polylepis.3
MQRPVRASVCRVVERDHWPGLRDAQVHRGAIYDLAVGVVGHAARDDGHDRRLLLGRVLEADLAPVVPAFGHERN